MKDYAKAVCFAVTARLISSTHTTCTSCDTQYKRRRTKMPHDTMEALDHRLQSSPVCVVFLTLASLVFSRAATSPHAHPAAVHHSSFVCLFAVSDSTASLPAAVPVTERCLDTVAAAVAARQCVCAVCAPTAVFCLCCVRAAAWVEVHTCRMHYLLEPITCCRCLALLTQLVEC